MNKIILILVLSLFSLNQAFSQRFLSLEDVVEIAINQSPASKRAETRKENRYWAYRTFKSNYVPQLTLSGTLPDFRRRVEGVEQNDGSLLFVQKDNNFGELELQFVQTIAPTGGRVFISSNLSRFDNFLDGTYNFGGDPVTIGFFQPLFSFNELKWDQEIEPLRYEESKRNYVEEYEEIRENSTALFFELLTAQVSLKIAELNVASNDTIYKIAQGRYQLGKVTEDELLRLELNLMNSRQQVAQSNLDLETAKLTLKTYLGFNEEDQIELLVPSELPQFTVDEKLALEMALQNRSDAIAFERQRLEADRDVAQALGSTGLNANLFGRFGLSNSGQSIGDLYIQPDNQLVANMGFTIPVVDWGRQKARRKTAEANQQLVNYTVQQNQITFEQEIITHVKRFRMLRDQVEISQLADVISQKRYEIAKNRYLIGKISVTDFNIALTDRDKAKQDYLLSLGNFWKAYFQLRRLTLYDFQENRLLYTPEE